MSLIAKCTTLIKNVNTARTITTFWKICASQSLKWWKIASITSPMGSVLFAWIIFWSLKINVSSNMLKIVRVICLILDV